MTKKIRTLDKNTPLLGIVIIGILLIGTAITPVGYSTGASKADSQHRAGAQPVYCGVSASADGYAALAATGNLGNASTYDVCEVPNSDVANSDLSATPVYDNYIMYDAGSLWATWSTSDDCIMVVSVMDAETNGGLGGYGDYVTASRHTFAAAGTEIFPGGILMPMPVVTEGTSTGTYIEIQWTALDNANLGTSESSSIVESYKIYRSTDNVTFTVLADSSAHVSASTMTYQDTTAAAATTYYYKIGVNFVTSTTLFTAWARSFGSAPVVLQDTAPPIITHTPETSATEGEPITITATITDDSSVTGASVFYRTTETLPYTEISMTNPSGDTWSGTIPALAVTTAGVEYYVSATDGTNTATHPAISPETSPHPITVSAAVTTGSISGTVYESDGETPIEGATVTVVATSYSDTTNSNGNYTITDVPEGIYAVTAGKTGYESDAVTNVVVTAAQTTSNVDFTLTAIVGDITGPMITNLLPVDASTVSTGTPTMSANYSDPSGIDTSSVVLKVDNVDVTDNATVTGTGVSYTPAAALSDAEHTVYLEVKDASNNSNAANTTWSFTVDTESPVITHEPVISGTAGVKIEITATITDINLTAASVFYRVHGTENYTSWPMAYVSNDDYTFDIPASYVTTTGVEYYIWAKDGAGNEATDGTAALPHSVDVSAANHAPTLSSSSVSPGSGKTDTTFTFSVTYTDADNDAPTIKNVYIDDVAHEMSSTDTDYTDGVVFTYSTTLSKGSRTYYFDFSDGTASVRLPTSGTSSGPSVTEKASKPGFIPSIGIIGTSLALLGAALIIWKKKKTEK